MTLGAALFSGPLCYFFDGDQYIRVVRGDVGAGLFDTGRPRAISTWGWPDGFGSSGIDAALSSGGVAESTFGQLSKCYFFDGDEYVRVTRGDVGAGTVDPGYPKPISNWGWPGGFGSNGIDAALSSGVVTEGAGFQPPSSKCYFFDGDQYIRVTRGDVGAGTVDPGYPKPISNWGWPGGFGSNGIDAALYSGSKCYFFDGDQYIRVTRGDVGAGTVDPGYPRPISDWGWPAGFAGAPGPTVRLHVKVLTGPSAAKIATWIQNMRDLFQTVGINVVRVSTEIFTAATLPNFNDLDNLNVGNCKGKTTDDQDELFANRNNAGPDDICAYFVRATTPKPFDGCANHPPNVPAFVVVPGATKWTLAHEVGHVLGLDHVSSEKRLMTDQGTGNITGLPPDLSDGEVAKMLNSDYSQNQ